MNQRAVIIDCDPGYDDALALMMAAASKELNILGITTSAGNQTPDKTYLNAKKIVKLLNLDIPVVRGASKPLTRALQIASNIHGESGMDGVILPSVDEAPSQIKAIDFIAEKIRSSDSQVTLIVTGPMTNIAIFLLAYPELKTKIAEIVFMGGACFGGNVTSHAEFNIFVDPEALEIVLHAGIPLVMIGLDVTTKAQFHQADIERLKQLRSPAAQTAVQILEYYGKKISQPLLADKDHIEGVHMHDPSAVAYVLKPELFTTFDFNVTVDTGHGMTQGMTIVDYLERSSNSKNVKVAMDVDDKAFPQFVIDLFKQFER